MSYWEKINTETKDGFDIVYSVTWEDCPLSDLFEDDEAEELAIQLERGDLQYFVARIEAYKEGIKLGEAYLGGNLYQRYIDFVGDSMYDDLVYEATEEAKANIKKLVEATV